METVIIAAVGRDGAIGRRGGLLHHLSADLRRFKALTLGHPVVMGRKTFLSLPSGPLPGRMNIVVTRSPRELARAHAGICAVGSVEEALEAARQSGGRRVFVIGGGEIYRQAIGMADILELTEIDADAADADTFFPPLEGWEAAETGPWQEDARAGMRFRFRTYGRRKSR